jgi:hypothetical protein
LLDGNPNDPNFKYVAPKPQGKPFKIELIDGDPNAPGFKYNAAPKIAPSSAGGAALRSAGGNVAPALGGAAGFGAGFATGGILTAPAEAIPIAGPAINLIGAFGGGLAGAFGGSSAVGYLQDKLLSVLPKSVVKALGQDDAQRQADQARHPIASFIGGLAPSALTMRPNVSGLLSFARGGSRAVSTATDGAAQAARALPPPAMTFPQRFGNMLASPGGRVGIGATVGGATEAGREVARGEDLSPAKIGLATAFGGVFNTPTALGNKLFVGGGNTAIRAMQVGAGPLRSGYGMASDALASGRLWADKRAGRVIDVEPIVLQPEQAAPPPAWVPPKKLAAPRGEPAGPEGAAPVKIVPVPGDPFAAPPEGPSVPPIAQPPAGTPQPAPAPAGTTAPPVATITPGVGAPPVTAPPIAPAAPLPVAGAEPQPKPAEPGPGEPAAAPPAASPPATPTTPLVATASLRPVPGDVAEGERLVRTPAGAQVRTRFEVVDASTLAQAEGDNQNRDRSRESTDLQVQDIISKFDPELLHEDPSSDRGAPIVGPDNAIDSGNGRVLTLNKIYDQYPDLAQKYRSMIEGRGFSTKGIERPVLVQRRMTDMTPEQRRQFVIDSNKDTKLELSPVERARSDADNITPEMLAVYGGGDLNSTGNAGFVQAFNKKLTLGELGNMIGSDRRLTTAGVQRIENAIVAHAYDDPKLLERMLESTTDETRSLTGSLADAAVPWARLRADAKTGAIDKSYDITADLADAAARVADGRRRGIKPTDLLSQMDAFDRMSPVTEELIRGFHNTGMTRSAGRKAVSQLLTDYIDAARSQKAAPGLFGEEPLRSPESILKDLLEQRDNPNGGGLFNAAPAQKEEDNAPTSTPSRNEGRNEGRSRQEAQGSRDRGKGRGQNVDEGGNEGGGEGVEDEAPDYTEGRSPAQEAALNAYDPDFLEASFTNRVSLFTSAADAVGIDPDEFTLLPAPRQVELLKQAIAIKYGVTMIVDNGLQERFAIDQMLDAFQNLQGMAHVLDLPERAINLGGKLRVQLQKGGNYLGVFYPGKGLIGLPRRTNSFSHEWGHALDFHLLDLSDGDGRGLTGSIRQRGDAVKLTAPADVREAFVDLLNAMFFTKAGIASEIMAQEAVIAKTKSDKVKAEAQAKIDRLKQGNSQARGIRTAFYKGAKAFDGPGGDYWTSPTEMFARAFEAYVSYKLEAAGLSTDFIGKGDANYLSMADERFAKTFPKGEERAHIFAAFEALFGNMAHAQMLGRGAAAEKPDEVKRRITDLDKTPAVARERGVIKRELDAIKRAANLAEKAAADRPNDPASLLEKAANFNGAVTMSMTGNLRMIQARSNSKTLQKLIDMLTKQDGLGDRTVTRTFAEDVHLQSKQALGRLSNILKANKLEDRKIADDMLLRDLLIGETIAPARLIGKDNYVKAAAAIRLLLDNEFYVNQKAGIDLGYTRNGYLARVLDLPKVYNDQQGFLKQAAKVYEIVFTNEFGDDADALLGNDELFPRFMRLAGFLAKKGYPIDTLPEVKALLRKINKLKKLAEKSDEPDEIDAKIAQLLEGLTEKLGLLIDEVRPAFAQERAEAWLGKINLHAGEEHNAASPDSKYVKKRSLPVEADKLMEKFYLSDPVESVTNYLNASARRTAYARRFGNDGKKRKAMFQAMANEGVSAADQISVERVLDIATGRKRSELAAAVQQTLSAVNAAGTMILLPRAVLSSLAEPFTSGMVTGDVTSGFKMMAMMLRGALGTPDGKVRFELARAMGIISDAASDEITASRYGQTYADTTRFDRYASRMFEVTGLTALTRAQKTAGIGLGHAYLDSLAGKVLEDGVSAEAKNHAIALMRELGIRDPQAFADELRKTGRLPTVEELDSAYGEDYRTAQLRFSKLIVQEPDAMDRPELAQNPVGRVIYGITGFSYAYWRNIVKRNIIMNNDIAKGARGNAGKSRGGANSADMQVFSLVASAALALLVNWVVSTAREWLLNPQRWKELEAKDKLVSTMFWLAMTRTFSRGALDPFIQAYTGLKYQRDLSNMLIGPGPGNFLQATQGVAQLSVSNSRKTNTAEYNALKGAYTLASPLMAFGLARIPGGPLVGAASGVAIGYVSSPAARDGFASLVVGKKDTPKTRTPTGYDKFLDGTLGPVPKKPRAPKE